MIWIGLDGWVRSAHACIIEAFFTNEGDFVLAAKNSSSASLLEGID